MPFSDQCGISRKIEDPKAVSYTHLDVYKRQHVDCAVDHHRGVGSHGPAHRLVDAAGYFRGDARSSGTGPPLVWRQNDLARKVEPFPGTG